MSFKVLFAIETRKYCLQVECVATLSKSATTDRPEDSERKGKSGPEDGTREFLTSALHQVLPWNDKT